MSLDTNQHVIWGNNRSNSQNSEDFNYFLTNPSKNDYGSFEFLEKTPRPRRVKQIKPLEL